MCFLLPHLRLARILPYLFFTFSLFILVLFDNPPFIFKSSYVIRNFVSTSYYLFNQSILFLLFPSITFFFLTIFVNFIDLAMLT